MSLKPLHVAALAALAGVSACASAGPKLEDAKTVALNAEHRAVEGARSAATTIGRAATGPHLAPVEDPSPLLGPGEVQMPTPAYAAANGQGPNSLWRAGARTFFNDQRATRVGDILTVKISIDDSAQVENGTSRQRAGNSTVGVPSLFGKQESLGRLLPPGGNFDPANLVSANGTSTASGKGTIARKEKIDLTLAATIAEVLSNGNLVVAGRQQVRVNGEMRELTVAGIVRPEDIAADNSIRHDQLAEARISYGGEGTLTAVQKPRWGQRIVDAISPW